MSKFDKEIKKRFKEISVPKSYHEKLDNILQTFEIEEMPPKKKKGTKKIFLALACLIFVVCILVWNTSDSQANMLEYIKERLVDLLKGNTDENIDIGVESETIRVESKKDLYMELQEKVIDTHSIYLLVKITAPTDIVFTEDTGFMYHCFCKGQNYNNSQLLSGAISCEFLETEEGKSNVATYLVKISFPEDLEEGCDVTAFFNDLAVQPYSEQPEMLVEGMWSITFPIYWTIKDKIEIEGEEDMVFSYINTTAFVKRIELTALGMILTSDVSNFPSDELSLADNSILIRLKMIDGIEYTIMSHELGENKFIESGSIAFEEENGKTLQKNILEFSNAVDINQIIGIYVEDLYIPVL